MIVLYDISTNYQIYPEIERGLNSDSITFATPPIIGENYNVIITGF